MKRSILLVLCITFGLAWGADAAAVKPAVAEPPDDAAVLRALPRLPAAVTRDHVCIVKEQVKPGPWKCTVYYTEAARLPWGRIPLGKKVQSVFIEPARAVATAGRAGNGARTICCG
jgi:hypothetical protein